jgi:class 3 adenylate cyclase
LTAISWAARNPERVSALVLWNSFARASEYVDSASVRAGFSLIDKDWQLYSETTAHVLLGWSEGEPARRYASLMRESVTPEALAELFLKTAAWEVTDLLPEVSARTLVMQRRNAHPGLASAHVLSAGIPAASLAVLEGDSQVPYLGDWQAVLKTIVDFLHEEGAAAVGLPSGMTAILFADIVDSTALTERLGDAAFRAKARDLDATLRSVIRDHTGTPIEGKLLGDGVLAVFTSARQAIESALVCASAGSLAGLPLHLGLHAGDVIREEGNVYGGAVNIAARISGLSAPGEVLVSQTVRDLARTSAGVQFEDRGEQRLKGVGEAVRVWAAVQGAND